MYIFPWGKPGNKIGIDSDLNMKCTPPPRLLSLNTYPQMVALFGKAAETLGGSATSWEKWITGGLDLRLYSLTLLPIHSAFPV